MNENQQIEKGTAEGFLLLYNAEYSTDYHIDEFSDAPDVKCSDSAGHRLNIEITMTEDRDRDIAASLGRSNHRDIANFDPNEPASCLSGNVMDKMVSRILDKVNKDYGTDVALVVRDTSGVDWDWSRMAESIAQRLQSSRNPFDRGIWIINRSKDRVFKIT